MNAAQLEIEIDGRVQVSGELSMSTVPALLQRHQWHDLNTDDIQIDLQGIERADSAGVALLIEWRRAAQQQQQTIRFQNIPSQMLAIARLSGVDELLALT
jgi:phospholipid transport system transporter-binding protein